MAIEINGILHSAKAFLDSDAFPWKAPMRFFIAARLEFVGISGCSHDTRKCQLRNSKAVVCHSVDSAESSYNTGVQDTGEG